MSESAFCTIVLVALDPLASMVIEVSFCVIGVVSLWPLHWDPVGLAGIAAGVWTDAHAFTAASEEPDVFAPRIDRAERESLLRGWRRAVDAALAWARSDA